MADNQQEQASIPEDLANANNTESPTGPPPSTPPPAYSETVTETSEEPQSDNWGDTSSDGSEDTVNQGGYSPTIRPSNTVRPVPRGNGAGYMTTERVIDAWQAIQAIRATDPPGYSLFAPIPTQDTLAPHFQPQHPAATSNSHPHHQDIPTATSTPPERPIPKVPVIYRHSIGCGLVSDNWRPPSPQPSPPPRPRPHFATLHHSDSSNPLRYPPSQAGSSTNPFNIWQARDPQNPSAMAFKERQDMWAEAACACTMVERLEAIFEADDENAGDLTEFVGGTDQLAPQAPTSHPDAGDGGKPGNKDLEQSQKLLEPELPITTYPVTSSTPNVAKGPRQATYTNSPLGGEMTAATRPSVSATAPTQGTNGASSPPSQDNIGDLALTLQTTTDAEPVMDGMFKAKKLVVFYGLLTIHVTLLFVTFLFIFRFLGLLGDLL